MFKPATAGYPMTDPHERDETDLRTTPVDPVDILARTIYGEARGESVRGKEAVASVVMNRVNRARKGAAATGGETT